MITEGIVSPTFFINSDDSESGTEGNFNIKVNFSQSNEFNQVCLTKASIPKTWTTVTQYNNKFTLDEDSTQTEITIPLGNYNAYDFRKILSDLITENSIAIGSGIIYAVYFDQTKSKYQIAVNSGTYGITNVSLIFGDNSAHKLLGFAKDSTNSFTSGGVITPFGGKFGIESTQQVNFQFTKYVVIKSSMAYDKGREGGDTSILARIPINNQKDGGYI